MLRVRGTLVPQAGGGGASQGERHAPAGPTPHSGLQPPLFGLIPSFITQVTTTATANIHPSAQPCSERDAVGYRPGASWYRRRKDNNRSGRVGPVSQRTNTVLTVDGGRTAEEERAAGMRASEAWDLGPGCQLPRYSTGPRGHGASHRFRLGFQYQPRPILQCRWTPHTDPQCFNKPLPSSTKSSNPRHGRVSKYPRFFPCRACRPHLSTLQLLRRPAGPAPHMPPDPCCLGCQ